MTDVLFANHINDELEMKRRMDGWRGGRKEEREAVNKVEQGI